MTEGLAESCVYYPDVRRTASISIGIITFILLFPAFGSSACAATDDGCVDEMTTLIGVTYTDGWIWLGLFVAIAAGLAVAYTIRSFGGRDAPGSSESDSLAP